MCNEAGLSLYMSLTQIEKRLLKSEKEKFYSNLYFVSDVNSFDIFMVCYLFQYSCHVIFQLDGSIVLAYRYLVA